MRGKFKSMSMYSKPRRFSELFNILKYFLKNRDVRGRGKAYDLISRTPTWVWKNIKNITDILKKPVYLIGRIKSEARMSVHLLSSFSYCDFCDCVCQPKDFDCFEWESISFWICWMCASSNQFILRKNGM